MSISYIEEFTTIPTEINFEPELFIYLQKLSKIKNKDINTIINELVRDHAESGLIKKEVPYIVPNAGKWTITSDRTIPYTPTRCGTHTIGGPDDIGGFHA